MRRSSPRWLTPYLDLSNTLFFLFVALFAVTLLVIGDTQSKAKVDTTSKLLIHLVWRDGSPNDMDLGLKTPAGHVVWFRQKEADFASLDHDNLGVANSQVTDAAGNVVGDPLRDEVIYVRKAIAGTYTVNVLFYGKSSPDPEPVTVTLTSVDPVYRTVISRKLTLADRREEQTAFRFTVDADGAVTGTDLIEEPYLNDLLGKS